MLRNAWNGEKIDQKFIVLLCDKIFIRASKKDRHIVGSLNPSVIVVKSSPGKIMWFFSTNLKCMDPTDTFVRTVKTNLVVRNCWNSICSIRIWNVLTITKSLQKRAIWQCTFRGRKVYVASVSQHFAIWLSQILSTLVFICRYWGMYCCLILSYSVEWSEEGFQIYNCHKHKRRISLSLSF